MQRDRMFVGSFAALAIALGLLGVRQSIAAVPTTAMTKESDSIVDVFQAQGALDSSAETPKGGSSTGIARVMDRFSAITKDQPLKKDGYLGSRTAVTEDGRQRIVFVWFKNEASMMKWYETQAEKEIIRPFFPALLGQKPKLNGALAANQPVMLVATLTPDFEGKKRVRPSEVSKASFEVFASAGPALALGPTFAPAS